MLRRLLIWLFGSAFAILLLGVSATLILLRTEFGQRLVLSYALPKLEAETGLRIEFETTSGAWPAQIALTGIVMSDEAGVWLKADTIKLDWQPARLLSNRIVINAAEIDNGYLEREPIIRESPDDGATGETPTIVVHRISLARFQLGEALIDQDLTLDLKGGMRLRNGRQLEVRFDSDIDTPGDFPNSVRELLGAGFRLKGSLAGNVRGDLAVSIESAETRDKRINGKGTGGYDVKARQMRADLLLMSDPSLAAWISSDFLTTEPISLKAKLSGPFKKLRIEAAAGVKDSAVRGIQLAPFLLEADFERTRELIEGPFAFVFEDKAGQAEGRARGMLDFRRDGRLRISEIDIDYRGTKVKGALDLQTEPEVTGEISFEGRSAELEALPIETDFIGDVTARGRIALGTDSTRLDIAATSDHLAYGDVSIDALSVTATGALDALALDAKARKAWHSSLPALEDMVVVALLKQEDATTVRFDRLTAIASGAALKLRASTTLTLAEKQLALSEFDISWGEEARFIGRGEHAGGELKLALDISDFELPQWPAKISGTIDVDTRRPVAGRVNLSLVPTNSAHASVQMDISGEWNAKRLALKGALEGRGDDKSFKRIQPLSLSLPLAYLRGDQLRFSVDGPVDGRLSYKGPIAPFVALAPLQGQTLAGTLNVDARVSGSLETPIYSGRISLTDTTYEHISAGILLDHLSIDGRLERRGAGYGLIANATASDGTTHAADAVPLRAKAVFAMGARPRLEASLILDEARAVHRENVTGKASGRIDLSGALPDLAAKGTIAIRSLDISIPDTLASDIAEIEVVPVDARGQPITQPRPEVQSSPLTVKLDIAVTAPRGVTIKGRGLESEWSADLRLSGTHRDPRLAGSLGLVKGRFDFSGRRFDLTRGAVNFLPARTSDPDLSIEAQHQGRSDTIAYVRVAGRASAPRITLSSDPPASEEDVMALVLFGKPAKELSAFEAVQTANAVSRLTGKGLIGGRGPDIFERARATLGLDLLDFSFGEEGAVSIGKYIQEGIYVQAKQGLAGQPGTVSVTIDVNKWLSLKTDVGQDSTGSAGIFWKRDY